MENLKQTSLFQAISGTITTISTIISPLVLITVIKDVNEAMLYIGENYAISLIPMTILFLVFSYHLLSIFRKKTTSIKNDSTVKIIDKEKSKENWYSKKPFIYIRNLVLISSLLITIYLLGLSSNGLHFPIINGIESSKVKVETEKMNAHLKDIGHEELTITYYCDIDNPICAIVPGGVHLSKKSAEETIEKVRKVAPKLIDYRIPEVRSFSLKEAALRKFKKVKSVLLSEPVLNN